MMKDQPFGMFEPTMSAPLMWFPHHLLSIVIGLAGPESGWSRDQAYSWKPRGVAANPVATPVNFTVAIFTVLTAVQAAS